MFSFLSKAEVTQTLTYNIDGAVVSFSWVFHGNLDTSLEVPEPHWKLPQLQADSWFVFWSGDEIIWRKVPAHYKSKKTP